MIKNRNIKISLDNPYFPALLFTGVGSVGFGIYGLISEVACNDMIFGMGFFLSLVVMLIFLFHWASMLEKIDFKLGKMPSILLLGLVFFKLYVAFTLFSQGQVSGSDLRFDAYGTSSLIILDGVANLLFFPVGYFSTNNNKLKKIILSTYVFSTAVSLFVAPSKSSLFNVGFTVLQFFFLRRKEAGALFPIKIFSATSLFILTVTLAIQVFFLVFIYGGSLSDTLFTIGNRIVNNFDTAIIGCMVDGDKIAPLNFFYYAFMPLLKRFDSSLYDLEYFNVPQWLLSEVFDISREGRFGYPNDNLYVALHFGGFIYLAIPTFLIIIFFLNYYFHNCLKRWRRSRTADPFQFALVLSIPLAYKSTQEFIGLLMILLIFWLFKLIILTLTSRKNLLSDKM